MKKIMISIGLFFVIMIVIIALSFTKIGFFPEDGYIIMSSKLESNLLNGDKDIVKVYKINKNQNIYKKWNKLYVGENKKTKIYKETPLFSKNKSRLINLFSEGNAISSNYEKEKLYKNLVLSNGKLYNYYDMKTVDDNNYIFMELDNKIYINSYDIEINTLMTKNRIPKSSFIYFLKDEIRYYYYKDGKYIYESIIGVDFNSNIVINGKSITYYEFLDNLGIFSNKKKDNDIEANDEGINKDSLEDENKKKDVIKDDYVVPKVTLSNLIVSTYSAYFKLNINDPQDRIKKSVTIEFIKDGKTYYKKAYNDSNNYEVLGLYPNQEYKVVGSYVYNNKNNNLVKVEFFNDTIKTKNLENESVKFDYKIENTYSNKLVIDSLQLNIDNKDLLSGISAVGININNREILLDTKSTNDIKNGKSVNLSTGDILKSNTKYDFEFIIYDIAQNKIPISNGKQSYTTSKQAPTFNVNISKKTYTTADVNVNLINKDDVKLNNIRYVLKSNASSEAIIDDINISGDTSVIKLNNLDENSIYTLQIIGDYDLEDGNGVIKNVILKDNIEFATESLKNHPIYYEFIPDNITSDSANIKLQLNNYYKNDLINQLISDIKVKLIDSEDYIVLTPDEVNEIRSGNQVYIKFDNLESNKEYKLEIYTKITEVGKKLNVESKIKTDSFTTFKKEPVVTFTNFFAANHYFNVDYTVYDKDEALVDGKAYLKVYKMDSSTCVDENDLGCEIESTVHSELINVKNGKLSANIELNRIDSGIYKVVVIGKKLSGLIENNGSNITIASLQFKTDDNIDGQINLNYLMKRAEGINLFDIRDNEKLRYVVTGSDVSANYKMNSKNNTVEMSVTNGKATFRLYMPEYNNKILRMSYISTIETDSQSASVSILCTENNCRKKNVVSSNTRQYVDVKVSENYISFDISVPALTNEYVNLTLKDLMITESDSIDYSSYKTLNKYIGSFNVVGIENSDVEYIAKAHDYKIDEDIDNKLIDCIGEESCNYNYFDFERNSHYSIDLYVVDKRNNQSYKIDELSFTTEKEIRAINTIEDLFAIHSKGSYIVNNDLDITNTSKRVDQFSGSIDFNGHKIITDNTKRTFLFKHLGSGSVVKNFVLELKFSNREILEDSSGFVDRNDGLIDNFIINVTEENYLDNTMSKKKNVFISIYNNGIIQNFIINFQKTYYVNCMFAGISLENDKIIRNGYLYGKNIKIVPSITTNYTYYVGLVARSSYGDVSNIFSTVGIDTESDFSNKSYNIGLISAYNEKRISNVYSYTNGNFVFKDDIVVGTDKSNKVSNSYYILENNIANYVQKSSIRTYSSSLLSHEFHKNALNDKNEKIFDITNKVVNGYFPQIKLNNSMPRQELIELPTVNVNTDGVDFVNIKNVNACYEKYDYNSDNPKYVNECSLLKDKEHLKKLNNNYTEDEISSISEMINNNNYEYILEINFDNKELKPINNISIDKINKIDILSQYYDIETGYVVAFVGIKNIEQYKSLYTLTNVNGVDITNRYINLELYKPIVTSTNNDENIESFMDAINNPGSYIIMNDIDFKNYNYSMKSINSVNIDANNHVFNHLENGTMFDEVNNSTIKNLKIDNYYYKYNIGNNNGGFIYNTKNSIIDNVHISNSKFYIDDSFGTITNLVYASTIKNCSVTNSDIISNQQSKSFRYIGGIVANNQSSKISNCFVSNLDIDIDANVSIIGGIVAYNVNSTAIVSNVYSDGIIKSYGSMIGGIIGSNMGKIDSSYSKMSLYTSGNNIGGIAGESLSFFVNNNLFLGNIINTSENDDVRAIVGNLDISANNYLYSSSRIDSNYSGTGELLVDYDTLESPSFYKNLMNFDNSYKIDDSIKAGILPKLYYDSRNDYIIMNQDDLYISNKKELGIYFNLKDYEYKEEENEIIVNLNIDNYLEYNNLDFQHINVISDELTLKSSFYQDGILKMIFTPKLYLDYYVINSIHDIYVNNNRIDVDDLNISIYQKIYKKISSVNDWMNIEGVAQNYLLTNDLDFSEYVNNAKIVNKNINRLVCQKEDYCKIENIESNLKYSLVNHLLTSISKVNFKNIKLTNDVNDNYGLFSSVYGSIDNVIFENITIFGNSSIGIIANDYSYNISNVTMNNIIINGISSVGSLSGVSYNKKMQNVNAKNITVNIKRENNTKNSMIGGLIGNNYNYGADSKAYQSHINLSCLNVKYLDSNTATNTYTNSTAQYIGGLIGYGRVITNVTIDGCDDGTQSVIDVPNATTIGGYAGSLPSNTLGLGGIGGGEDSAIIEKYFEFKISNISIKGLDSVGGYVGYMSNVTYTLTNINISNNVTVSGKKNVGGLIGRAYQQDFNDIFVDGVTITATEDNAGGALGQGSISSYNIIVKDSTITAKNNVGGVVGYFYEPSYGRTNRGILVENTNIEAINNNAGGLIGKFYSIQSARSNVFRDATVSNTNNCRIKSYNNSGGALGFYDNRDANGNYDYIELYGIHILNYNIESRKGNAGGLLADYAVNSNIILNHAINYKNNANVIYVNLYSPIHSDNLYPALKDYSSDSGNYVKNFVYKYNKIINGNETYTVNDKNVDNKEIEINESTGNYLFTYADVDNFKDASIYSNSYFNTSNLNTYFPRTKFESGTKVSLYNPILIPYPEESNTNSINSPMLFNTRTFNTTSSISNSIKTLDIPDIYVYSGDVDKINIDFSNYNQGLMFKVNDGDYKDINKKTYTLYYNYLEDFTITVTDGFNEYKYDYKKEDLINDVFTLDDKYYIIKDGSLITNDNITGNYIHIFNGKLLTRDSKVYDLTDKSEYTIPYSNFEETTEKPLYEIKYQDDLIKTYYSYSDINNSIKDNIEFLSKNNEIYMISAFGIDTNIKSKNFIIDSYNGKKYEVVLKNGKLYNLYDNMAFPDGFINEGIKSISNNIDGNSNLIAVLYDNGNYICFNYKTKEIVILNKERYESITNYLSRSLKSSFKYKANVLSSVPNENIESYNEINELVDKLNEKPIINVIEEKNEVKENKEDTINSKSDSSKNSSNSLNKDSSDITTYNINNSDKYNYNVYYNQQSNEYEVYELNSFISNENTISVNDKTTNESSVNEVIKNDNSLKTYYFETRKSNSSNTWKYIFELIFVTIIALIFVLYLYLRNKKTQYNH